ncbi:MAG: transcription antitermination factor NusB [Armatimonadetes bacterium]|nr:transcription antitermination factor NusB [Armatimonadota bacterium]NIT30118.1 transcription antitermination factor NusB [Armatimonadota bacterium]
MKRRRAREYALQLLYEHEFADSEPDISGFFADKKETKEVVDFTSRMVRGTLRHINEVDAAIKDAAEHWVLERMAAVDRNILRFATFELLYSPDVPPAVVIDEALEIAKRFSSTESAAFINGILDRIAKTKRKQA